LFTTHRFKSGKYRMTTPTVVTQYADNSEVDIAWDNNLPLLTTRGKTSISTVKPLLHIARSPKYDLIYNTWYVQLTGFNFDSIPDTISDISLTVEMNRGGRIADDTIQLCYQGELIGENQAQPAFITTVSQNESLLHPTTTYSGDLTKWKVTNLTSDMIQDPSFGITLRYKSHPAWPHKTFPVLYAVSLQIS